MAERLARAWSVLTARLGFLSRSPLDTQPLLAGLEPLAERLLGENTEKTELEGWLRLAERSLQEVTHLTEYEDEKASRILQAVAFMSALAAGVYVAVRGTDALANSGLAPSIDRIFFLYAALVVFGALVLIWGVRPVFNIPRGWPPSRLHAGELGDDPPRSRLFFERIVSVRPDRWAAYFAGSSLDSLRTDYLRDCLHETYLVADKLRTKVLLLRFGVFFLAASSLVLLTWIGWCAVAVCMVGS